MNCIDSLELHFSINMKAVKKILSVLFFALAIFSINGHANEPNEPINEWLFGTMTAWDGNTDKHHRHAKALGYYAVAEGREMGATKEYSKDLYFYLNDPHKNVQPDTSLEVSGEALQGLQQRYPFTFARYPELPRAINMEEIQSMRDQDPEVYEVIKADFERTKCWAKNPNRGFPYNLAQLQTWGTEARSWEPCPDFQQQEIVEAHVNNVVRYLKEEGEIPEQNYHFKGIVIDVIELWDEFDWNSHRGILGSPNTERYTPEREGITHDYATLREGWFQYLAQLRDALEAAYPDREIKFIWEPTPMYEKWVAHLEDHDYASITPEIIEKMKGDALVAEKPGLHYLEDTRFQEYGWTLSELGTATGDLFTKAPYYPLQLKYFGEITARGANFLTYGTFDRSRRHIDTYDPQFTLIRALSGWENYQGTPVEDRIWDNEQQIYLSPNIYADSHAIAGLHPRNGNIYAVFLDENARIPLDPELQMGALQNVNEYWEPTDNADFQIEYKNGYAQLKDFDGEYPVAFVVPVESTDARHFTSPEDMILAEELNAENLIISGIINPDAEEGAIGWKTGGEAIITTVNEPVYSGESALRVSRRQAVWHGAMIGIDGFMMSKMQGPYEFSVYVQPQDTADTFMLALHFHDGGTKRAVDLGTVEAQPGEWTQLHATADLDWQDWVSESRLMIRRKNKTESFYVDNFEADALR